ncbi:hypothetical protein MTP03_19710 [Tsukamurella sp. PLM1]|nr:arabinosyltransferase domain-containing protein [Tsukamurella sp. PLM1]BDH57032.1 hypothetical protein MTP03_19710 [Tsukamurella sp. PLM1]
MTLSAAPTGSFAFVVFLVAAAPLWRAVRSHVRTNGYAASLLPLAAAGGSVLYLVFADHGLVEMLQSTTLLGDVGPSEPWHREIIRYEALFQLNPNGSVARRFAMLAMFLSAAVAAVLLLWRRRIPGIAAGPRGAWLPRSASRCWSWRSTPPSGPTTSGRSPHSGRWSPRSRWWA